MKSCLLVTGMILMAWIGISCTGPSSQSPVEAALTPLPLSQETKAGWEAEWGKTLQSAQREGRVVIYADTPAPAIKEAAPMFKNKYGIILEVVQGRGPELRSKVGAERGAKLYLPDIYISGASGLPVNFSQGWTDPFTESMLILPEVADPGAWYGDKLPWLDKEKRGFIFFYYPTPNIAINTELVNKGEINSYYDLLNPKWKDRILLGDPSITGSAFSFFMNMVEQKVLDLDFFRQLMKQNPAIHRDYRLMAQWLAQGKYSIAVAVAGGQIEQFQDVGAPVEWAQVKEGTYLSIDGAVVTLMNKRPHPRATTIFVNWFLSKEGQLHVQKTLGYTSARVDIGTEGVDKLKIRRPGVKYYRAMQTDLEWYPQNMDRYLELAKEIVNLAK